jgi:hypothetical protein
VATKEYERFKGLSYKIYIAKGEMVSMDNDGSINEDFAVFLGKTLEYTGSDPFDTECVLWKAADPWDQTTEAMLKANIDKMKKKFITIIQDDSLSLLE